MPVDYTILRQAPEPVPAGSLGSLGRMEAISRLAEADRQRQQDAQADALLSQISAQYADNPDGAVGELRRRGFAKQAQALELHIADLKKKQFEARKVDLENQRLTGQIDGDRAEREMKAMDANSPEKMLTFVAGATTPEEWENGKALMRFKFGAKADPVIATLGDFDPARAGFAGRTVMGPDKVADNERQLEANRATVANQAATQAHQAAVLAESVRHNQATESNQRRGQDLTDKRASATAKVGATGADGQPIKLSVGQQEAVTIADDVTGLIDEAEALGKATGWRGVGFGKGTVAGLVKSATGYGSEESELLRNSISNIQGTIAKLRGGTSFTASEKAMLNKYTPSINDGDDVIQAKLKSLRSFLGRHKANILRIASGNAGAAPSNVEIRQVGSKFRVTGKDGQEYEFPSKMAAEAFKKDGG